jgi:hypothetical protein
MRSPAVVMGLLAGCTSSTPTERDAGAAAMRSRGAEPEPERGVDVNADGFADILCPALGEGWVLIHFGGQRATVGLSPTVVALPPGTRQIVVVGDLDGGGSDFVVARGHDVGLYALVEDRLVLRAELGIVTTRLEVLGDLRSDGDVNLGDVTSGTPQILSIGHSLQWQRATISRTPPCPRGEDHGRVEGAGDIDGDGHRDVLITSVCSHDGPDDDWRGEHSATKVTWCRGGSPTMHCVGEFAPDGPGDLSDVSPVGDVDGDGRGDLFVSVRRDYRSYSGTHGSRRHAFLHLGTEGGPAVVAATEIVWSSMMGSRAPYEIPLGDVDGDGFADIGLESGAANVARGGPGGLVDDGQPPDELGLLISLSLEIDVTKVIDWHIDSILGSPGDVDGDGRPDLVVLWDGTPVTYPAREPLSDRCAAILGPLPF